MRPPFTQPLSPSHARVRWRSEGTPNPVGLAAQQSRIACTFLHHVATAKSPSISTPVYYPWPNRTSTTIWFWRTCVSITPTPHLSLTADSAFFPSVSTHPPPLPPPPRPIFCVSTCLPPFLPPPACKCEPEVDLSGISTPPPLASRPEVGAILRRCSDAGDWACLGVHTGLAAYFGWAHNCACICHHDHGADEVRGEV